MTSVSFPLDTTGLSSVNKITREPHVLTEVNSDTYRIIIPTFAPFYLDNFVLEHKAINGNVTPLDMDVDYTIALMYLGASRSVGKAVYGGITMNTDLPNGTILVTYQNLGGEWVADSSLVLERLANMAYNPRTTVWDIVTDKPNAFPPTNHNQSLDYVFGQQDLINAIHRLVSSLAAQPGAMEPILRNLIANNQLVDMLTKDRVGLSNVVNLPIASPTDIAAGFPVQKYVRHDQVLQMIEAALLANAP